MQNIAEEAYLLENALGLSKKNIKDVNKAIHEEWGQSSEFNFQSETHDTKAQKLLTGYIYNPQCGALTADMISQFRAHSPEFMTQALKEQEKAHSDLLQDNPATCFWAGSTLVIVERARKLATQLLTIDFQV